METKISLVPTSTLHSEKPKEYPQPHNKSYGNKSNRGRGKNPGYKRKYSARPPNHQSEKIKNEQYEDQGRDHKLQIQSKDFQSAHEESNGQNPDAGDVANPDDFAGHEENQDYEFVCDFPRVKDYSNWEAVVQAFPHLKEVNSDALDIHGLKDARCVILRSNNEDDIHKAIKYGIWTSTPKSNDFLNNLFKDCEPKKIPIYLFYSVVRSGQFIAVAQMTSQIIEKSFQFWWEPEKWVNHFQVKWIYVKDIPYSHFDHLYVDGDLPITRARDCTNVPLKITKEMLQIYKDYSPYNSIFNVFGYMDQREDMLRHYRYSLQMYQRLYMSNGLQNYGYSAGSYAPTYQPSQYFTYNSFPSRKKELNSQKPEENDNSSKEEAQKDQETKEELRG